MPASLNLLSPMRTEMSRRLAFGTKTFTWFYGTSICSHQLNLRNRRDTIKFEGSREPDLRVHLLMLAYPSWGKTYWAENFALDRYALFPPHYKMNEPDLRVIKTIRGQQATDAGFIGSKRFGEGGDPYSQPGALNLYKDQIMVFEEFHALTAALKSPDAKMKETLLSVLDSGRVTKDLLAGRESYQTYVTFWAATQPDRFYITGGLMRRLIFMLFVPGNKIRRELKLRRRKAHKIRPDLDLLEDIRGTAINIVDHIDEMKEIVLDEQTIYDFCDKYNMDMPHATEMLIEKLAMGCSAVKGRFEDDILVATLDAEDIKMVKRMLQWRDQVMVGPQLALPKMVIREIIANQGVCTYKNFIEKVTMFNVDTENIDKILARLDKLGHIRRSGNFIRLRTGLNDDSEVRPTALQTEFERGTDNTIPNIEVELNKRDPEQNRTVEDSGWNIP